jgi:hypothetical protein
MTDLEIVANFHRKLEETLSAATSIVMIRDPKYARLMARVSSIARAIGKYYCEENGIKS